MIRRLKQGLLFFEQPQALRAALTWPTFSFTAFRMVSVLARKGLMPRTVLDVGANIGQFAIAAAKFFPHATIHAFEPLPSAAAALRRHAAGLPRVEVHQVALGDREGRAAFRVSANSVSSSLLRATRAHSDAFPDAAAVQEIEVQISTLDRELQNIPLEAPVLLKIDIQGAEAQALRGAASALERIEHVLIEASLVPLYEGESTLRELSALLENRGFRFETAVGFLESPRTGELLQIDALFRAAGKAAPR